MFEVAFGTSVKCDLYPFIVKQIFQPCYYYLNSIIFHEFLGRIDLCNAKGGIKVKVAVTFLTDWYLNFPLSEYREALSELEYFFIFILFYLMIWL